MIENIIGVIIGAIIAVFITITVENLRKPKLSIEIDTPGDREYQNRPARDARFLYVRIKNHQLPKFARWMTRNPATSCHGTITFHYLDGQNYFNRSMPIRWSGSPEPAPILVQLPDRILSITDPSKLITRKDIQPGESEPIDIAAKFDNDENCFGWSNGNYSSDPVWRNPEWALPAGRYLVKVTIETSGEKVSEVFRLVNNGLRTDFRLESKMTMDKI